ncbi:SET domain-containing protein-lysine N-methyltransferase [Rivularia sp. UHCC 0363]|uniref:SET domain-containing protein-lysine N-methyltransferase n=1 Tax=Rivularia sp. UHCC 0363 TaxID=3110244 RepID=UPI002B1EC6A4|nr:SET domain-containing protein-lysine N-methyltransferase [Rivularia sp. UHCC 0363]MEA5594246.1 SET domain-containing protein-lysine N-methyltransferase [Rivularia sp. UHCC 0363]
MKDGFELRYVDGKGEGMFATQAFKPGQTVMVGRIEKNLDENNSHASQIAQNKFVLHAGFISKVNHSCDPNCGIRVNQTGAHDFVAMKNIGVGEEFSFDYAMRNYSVNYFPPLCMCGTKKCRGRITGWKDLPESRRKDYEGFVAPYLLELEVKS